MGLVCDYFGATLGLMLGLLWAGVGPTSEVMWGYIGAASRTSLGLL